MSIRSRTTCRAEEALHHGSGYSGTPRGQATQTGSAGEEFADVGVRSAHADPQAVCSKLAAIRTAARRAFVYEYAGRRVASARLRNMAPVRKDNAVGDIVSDRRGTDPIEWSPAGRTIGFT